MECTNYRGISVKSIVGKKVFARVLNERVKVKIEDKVMDEQGGFRAGRGCAVQVFVVRQVVEEAIEKDKEAYMAFADMKKAYDNVSREKLWMVLEEYGVEGKLLRAIQALYNGGMACVKVGQSKSKMFHVCKGVRQGCAFSPWLFNVFISNKGGKTKFTVK